MPANDISQAIEATIREQLGAIVDSVEIRFGDDHLDEASIFVDIVLTETAPADLGRQFGETQLAVMAMLEKLGERRFPYLATKRPNDEYPEDVFLKPRRRRA